MIRTAVMMLLLELRYLAPGKILYLSNQDINLASAQLPFLTTLWQHELLDENLTNNAYFSWHKNHSFITKSDKPENDALLLKGAFSLQHANGVFVELDTGGICCNADFSSFGAALDIGYRF